MTAEGRPEGFREPPSINGSTSNLKANAPTKCCTPNLKLFIGVLALCYFSKSLTGSYTKSTITQVERRFEIPSSTVGIIDGSFEMGNLLVITMVSYFGAKFHRPRIIGTGALLMSLGTFLMALPHFLMGRYNYETAAGRTFTSDANSTFSSPCSSASSQGTLQQPAPGCQVGEEESSPMWIMVLVGNIIRGIGEATIGPLGVAFIDDFARPENSAFYIGCLHTIAVIGPLFGYTLGSLCASLYVDIGFVNLDSVTITPQDSRWVGAWWLGYVVAGGLTFITALPFWFLPRSLPEAPRPPKNQYDEDPDAPALEPLNTLQEEETPNISEIAKDFLPSLKRLFTNKIYILYLLSNIVMFNAFVVIITYTPKFFEQQFGMSASKTNFLIGIGTMPAVSLGIFLSGVIMKKFKLGLLGAARVAFFTSIGGFLLTLPFFALSCQNIEVAGLTALYPGPEAVRSDVGVLSTCNNACGCHQNQWDPVCGQNGVTYISPCLAGCTSTQGAGRNMSFHGCSCIQSSGLSVGNSSAVLGQCPREKACSTMVYIYVALQAVSFFVYCLGSTPMFIITLRSVEPELKSLSVGVFMLMLRVLGGIPAPMYFGALIDSTCLKWGSRRCGGSGACRLYDINTFRWLFLGVTSCLRLLGYVMFWVAITQIKRTLLRARRAQDIELQKTQGNRDQAQDNTENEASEKMNISDGQSADGSEKMGITDSLAANGNDKMNIIGGHAATGSEGMNIDDKNARQTDD
ncbi:solute carrier organic anion transporter family member 1C1-like [Clupea harengus]|uniref:Solute carrier organic anion transporter family member n=1 Tax=Clupea harengus TaxID=7950 RepID=A0A6P3VNN1_CLUHA|nr:solute carrier organic anion transporter family member 1C1-like [Clupea harengus]